MTAKHRMPAEMFAALAGGRGGARAVETLRAARRSRTLLLVNEIVRLAEETGHPASAAVAAAFATLRRLPLNAVLDHPRVGVWALRTALLLDRGSVAEAAPGQLAAVAAAVQVRAAVPGVVELGAAEEIVLPSLGVFRPATDAPVRVVTSPAGSVLSDGHTETAISTRASERWQPVDEVCVEHGGLRLALSVDGIACHHLPEEVTALDRFADEREAVAWRDRLAEGWRLLVDDHRAVAEEVAATLRVLTPLRSPEVGLVSATFANSFGCVAMSLPDNANDVALTFAHEVQHAKLSVLGELFPLVENDSEVLLYAPWRPDPRPPDALLQGAYAHLGVAAFWRVRDDFEARVECTRWRVAVLTALDALDECGALTALGVEFVARMRAVLESWSVEGVSSGVRVEASRRNEEHRARFQVSRTP